MLFHTLLGAVASEPHIFAPSAATACLLWLPRSSTHSIDRLALHFRMLFHTLHGAISPDQLFAPSAAAACLLWLPRSSTHSIDRLALATSSTGIRWLALEDTSGFNTLVDAATALLLRPAAATPLVLRRASCLFGLLVAPELQGIQSTGMLVAQALVVLEQHLLERGLRGERRASERHKETSAHGLHRARR